MNDYGWIGFVFFLIACAVFYVVKRPKKNKESVSEVFHNDKYNEAIVDLEYLEKLHSSDEETLAVIKSLKVKIEILNHPIVSNDAYAKIVSDEEGNIYRLYKK